jgi:chromosome segregation ATPase
VERNYRRLETTIRALEAERKWTKQEFAQLQEQIARAEKAEAELGNARTLYWTEREAHRHAEAELAESRSRREGYLIARAEKAEAALKEMGARSDAHLARVEELEAAWTFHMDRG